MDSKLNKAIKEFLRSGSVEKMDDSQSIDTLRERNIIIPSVEMGHDELLELLFHEIKTAKKNGIVESFLSGLEDAEPQSRAALSAFSIAQHFPKHKFKSKDGIQCEVCGGFKHRKLNLTLYNIMRYVDGATNSGTPEQLYLFLKKHNETPAAEKWSTSILDLILNSIRSSDAGDTPLILEKKIRGVPSVKVTKEESRGLLDLLGQIGILESSEHKGFLHEYKNIGVMPRKSRSSDWSYPVDFWKGEFGVNENAVDYWFGDYLDSTN